MSFFLDVHNDFFEEVAKLRAARRLWARLTRERLGCRDPRSWLMRAHCPDGRRLAHRPAAAQQRRADGDPGAGRRARRHPVAAHELARRGVRDPLGGGDQDRRPHPADPARTRAAPPTSSIRSAGSYYVESLTTRIEEEAVELIERIDDMGGMIAAIESGYANQMIARLGVGAADRAARTASG